MGMVGMKRLLSLTFILLLAALVSGCELLEDNIFTVNKSHISTTEKPSSFVYIKDIIPNAVIDLRYCGDNNFVGAPIDGYLAPNPVLTKNAVIALKQVQDELNRYSLGIKIYDAYRPQSAVEHFKRWLQDPADTKMKAEYYPDIDKSEIHAYGFIAHKSGHSRGSTVDLTIVDLNTGEELDMGSSFDFFGDISAAEYKNLTAQQRANRLLLRSIMERNGFKHYKAEWWHFILENEPYPDTYFDFPVQ